MVLPVRNLHFSIVLGKCPYFGQNSQYGFTSGSKLKLLYQALLSYDRYISTAVLNTL